MEGLLLARAVLDVQARLPLPAGGWVFPDETTAALLVGRDVNLVLSYRPPQPGLFVSRERLSGEPRSPFQRTLAARARGDLVRVEQLKLDRVVRLDFSGERGFVDVPPVRLVFELTGRNANVLLLEGEALPGEEWEGRIVAGAREVTNARNRFRTIRTGGRYTPPPPYEKLDPREVTLEGARAAGLQDVPLGRWRDRVDGIGLVLGAELARRADLGPKQPPGEELPRAFEALQSLVRDPSVHEGALSEGVRAAVRADREDALRRALAGPLTKRRTLLLNQLGDVERAALAYEEAQAERGQADLLMAYAHTVPAGAQRVTLPGFDGQGEVTLNLDPSVSAIQNAQKLYARARRREEVFDRLAEREPNLQSELREVEEQLTQLETTGLKQLEALRGEVTEEAAQRPTVGTRFTSPGGYEVLVGRNNKENDTLTHRLARSTDYWFHAQGYPGSHVIVRTGGKELAVPDILMAAGVAAWHSKARASGNVPVDYTRVKHVWKPRGAPAGRVLYAQQKTVFVDPALPQDDSP